MMVEYEYQEAVRKFAAARREVENVETELAQQGSNLERLSRLKHFQQVVTQAERDLGLKVRAWEECKQREASSTSE